MNIILLSGGSGKRLWPLSNELRSKQFLKLLKNESGQNESMLQRVYRQLKQAGLDSKVVIAASTVQQETIRAQLGDSVDIVLEPERRNTYPAIALASSFLKTERGCSSEDVAVVLPVDFYVGMEYFSALKKIEEAAKAGAGEIVLMGIEPSVATSKYGYILPDGKTTNGYETVQKFVEKPDETVAEQLIKNGAVWNGGVFAYRLGYMEKVLRERGFPMDYKALYSQYADMRSISFDYEVVETTSSVSFVRYGGDWKDLGTWNTLADEMTTPLTGAVIVGEGTSDTYVINESKVPVVVLGAKDLIVVAGPDGILVTGREESTKLRDYADMVDAQPRYEECSWGEYEVLDRLKSSQNTAVVRRIHLQKGKTMGLQERFLESKAIILLEGECRLFRDGKWVYGQAGDTFRIGRDDEACVQALSELYFIEASQETA